MKLFGMSYRDISVSLGIDKKYVQKIKVLPEDFSVTNGLLTPTLKLRRGIIEKKYQKEIDEMYAG